MKENSREELKQRLEKLYRTQQARLDAGADDLDTREEIAEVEEEIKELQDDMNEQNNSDNYTNVGSIENSIEKDIAITKKLITTKFNNDYSINNKDKEAIEHILTDYKRVLKENETYKKQYFGLIDKIENKIANFDYEYKKAERKNNQERANYYWDLTRNFIKILGGTNE